MINSNKSLYFIFFFYVIFDMKIYYSIFLKIFIIVEFVFIVWIVNFIVIELFIGDIGIFYILVLM